MEIRYEITPSDHLEMLKVKSGVSAKLTNFLLEIAGICVGIFSYYFFGGGWFVVIVTFVTLALVQLFLPYILHRKIYYRNRSLFEVRTLTFGDEGLRSEKQTGSV